MGTGHTPVISFLERHAIFIDSWGNFLIISGFILFTFLIFLANARMKKNLLRVISVLIFLFILILLTGLTFFYNSPVRSFIATIAHLKKSIGKEVPGLEFTDETDMKTHNLGEYRGKGVILVFRTRQCQPCIPVIAELSHSEPVLRGQAVLISLAENRNNPGADSVLFASGHVIRGYYNTDSWIQTANYVPLTIFINKDGIIKGYLYGETDPGFLKKIVAELF